MRTGNPIDWYVSHADNLSPILGAFVFLGVPAAFGISVALGWLNMATASHLTGLMFWSSLYCFLASAIFLVALIELLKINSHQRTMGRSSIEEARLRFFQSNTNIGTKLSVVLFFFTLHILIASMATCTSALATKQFILGS